MLNNDESVVDQFVGGDVYQAFLSATKYHRWHSPVTGTIKKAYIKQGSYYSGTESQGMDPGSPNFSQGYIAHVATRAIIYIEADDPKIGLIIVMPIGMAEVSSCMISDKIKPGYRIKKGEELGYFQYGGSTYCLISDLVLLRNSKSRKARMLRWASHCYRKINLYFFLRGC